MSSTLSDIPTKEISVQLVSSRIKYIDGLRGIAILLVVLYHAYVRWPDLVITSDTTKTFPILALGWLGVQLFFLISGFVVAMTLEKCTGFWQFMGRRWLRLFPAMLLCSALVFATAPFFPHRPGGSPQLTDCIPGLTLVTNFAWNSIPGVEIRLLENAFWSLFVEVHFYIVFGAFYFLAGIRKAALIISGIFCLAVISYVVLPKEGIDQGPTLRLAISALGFKHFGWFATGIFFYLYKANNGETKSLILAVIIGAMSALATKGGTTGTALTIVGALAALLLFALPLLNKHAAMVLSSKPLTIVGFLSYPLYLIHENMMVSTIVSIQSSFPQIPVSLVPLVPISGVSVIAYIVAQYAERPIRNLLASAFIHMRGDSH
jgi:peptidoglycan/LPS O-acetylase OafA/YrhL